MTIRQVRRQLLPFWQEALNLREWKIVVKFGTAKEMEDAQGIRCQGLNYISVEELESHIFLDRKVIEQDVESTLVHELLHLVFDGHKNQTMRYDPMQERALNRTAGALMRLAATARSVYAAAE